MSAFFVGYDHTNALLTFAEAVARGNPMPLPDGTLASPVDAWGLTRTGQQLIRENLLAVATMYPDHDRSDEQPTITNFEYKRDPWVLAEVPSLPVVVIKLCQCYRYQCDADDTWPDSYSAKFLDYIMNAAIAKLPGYDRAPWCYDR